MDAGIIKMSGGSSMNGIGGEVELSTGSSDSNSGGVSNLGRGGSISTEAGESSFGFGGNTIQYKLGRMRRARALEVMFHYIQEDCWCSRQIP
jgi:hypothetical protein